LEGVDAVVLDEFHERHLDSDLALALLKRLQRSRPELRIIVMSATLDTAPIVRYLENCPILRSEGRSKLWRPERGLQELHPATGTKAKHETPQRARPPKHSPEKWTTDEGSLRGRQTTVDFIPPARFLRNAGHSTNRLEQNGPSYSSLGSKVFGTSMQMDHLLKTRIIRMTSMDTLFAICSP